MQIQHIFAENYKTYLHLDLDISVEKDRPIILIGGANGGGKTTLFDTIAGALYGLEIKDKKTFRELLNSSIEDINNKKIILEIAFTGYSGGSLNQYKLTRTYAYIKEQVSENVTLLWDSNTFSYGTFSSLSHKKEMESTINSIIKANLPKELSNYFLFDAMKTGELVKEEQLSGLIQNNIQSVMGFDKYAQLQKASQLLFEEEYAKRLKDKEQKKEYELVVREKEKTEQEKKNLEKLLSDALEYAADNKQHIEQLRKGQKDNEAIQEKIKRTQTRINDITKEEKDYTKKIEEIVQDIEKEVFFPKLADLIKSEVELILQSKKEIENANKDILSKEKLEQLTKKIVHIIQEQYTVQGRIDTESIVEELENSQKHNDTKDKYDYLNRNDIEKLSSLITYSSNNKWSFIASEKERLNKEIDNLPLEKNRLENYKKQLTGDDYSLIKQYEKNDQTISQTKDFIKEKEKAIREFDKQIEKYDYQIPTEPDPKYDLLCKLPKYFEQMSKRLLHSKKKGIEQRMQEELNKNLVIYQGMIDRVVLSDEKENITFKMYHKQGNEIYLSQLNAGAKQTVMQVLLKVLYELGDYDPPVMIDTVMGVLDQESRDSIIENYFPDLASQTILLSTDTEIRKEGDFVKLAPFVSKVFTLHRDKEKQCTTISNDYFGIELKDVEL